METTATTKEIKRALQARTGKTWSVTRGNGTARGWITITAPASRRTWTYRLKENAKSTMPEDYEWYDSGEPGHEMTPQDRAELATALGLDSANGQGVNVPAGLDYYAEYIDRANGRTPKKFGRPYWD